MLTSQFGQINALVGFLLPLLIAVIQKERWRNSIRVAVGTASCAVAAVITTWADGKLNFHDLAASAVIIFILTKTTYLAVWKPSGLAPAIQNATGGANTPFELPAP